jgi:hypothetical protein
VSILKKSVGVAVAALAAMAMMASSAVADEASWVVKKDSDPLQSATSPLGGTNNGPALLETSAGDIWCDQSYSLRLDENPGYHHPVDNPDGVVRGTLTSLTFTNCDDNIFLFNVQSVTANNLPWSGIGDAHDQTLTLYNPSVTINLGLLGSCVYQAGSMVADADNANSRVHFVDEPMTRTSGICPATGTYTATYDVRDADGDPVELIHQDPDE